MKYIFKLFFLFFIFPYSYAIKCYTGTRYHIGQDELQDVEECSAPLFTMEEYCYRFEADATVERIVKLGCASILCSAIRNHCEQVSMGPLTGRICCCNHNNFCNSGNLKKTNIFIFLLSMSTLFFYTFNLI
uniref:Activin_recp domain-containing protein n=1 Tax=Parastrongyloides trichosuri TaxID=131310 RepID=A0A0N4Z363_PARTI